MLASVLEQQLLDESGKEENTNAPSQQRPRGRLTNKHMRQSESSPDLLKSTFHPTHAPRLQTDDPSIYRRESTSATLRPCLKSHTLSRGYGAILPTSLTYIMP